MVRGTGQVRRDVVESVLGGAPDRIVGLETIGRIERRNSVERKRVELGVGRRPRSDGRIGCAWLSIARMPLM